MILYNKILISIMILNKLVSIAPAQVINKDLPKIKTIQLIKINCPRYTISRTSPIAVQNKKKHDAIPLIPSAPSALPPIPRRRGR